MTLANENIFDYVKAEESSYKVRGVTVAEGWDWGMSDHITKCILYKDGRLITGNSDDKPVKNIILPIVNVHYRTEGFDVKNIEIFVDNPEEYYKSFLIRKFHEKWALEQGMDTFIDEVVMSYVDFGGVLVKKVKGARPEVIPLQKLAFCDQTDLLAGPFAIKHQYSIDQLSEKRDVWSSEAIDEVINQARQEKINDQAQGQSSKTPGKNIVVYEVHGVFPKVWRTDGTEETDETDADTYERQIHIIAYYNTKDVKNKGVTLFKGKEKDGLFKVLKRDSRYGTALGRSAIEELFEPQVWVNYSLIQMKAIMDKAAIMLGITDDPTFATKNKIVDLEPGEWVVKEKGSEANPFVFPTGNITPFQNFATTMENHARTTGSANDSVLGISPSSGTPFKLQELVVNQNEGIHEYRRGQIASFIEEIYREWIIPEIVSEMNKGQEFLTELSLDELEQVSDLVVTNYTNEAIKKAVLEGKEVSPDEVLAYKQVVRESFKKDTKKFTKIFKDEFADSAIDVKVNVAGKQKNLDLIASKLTNIYREAFSNPALMQDPNAVKLLNNLFEVSGLSPINFKMQPVSVQSTEAQLQEPQPVV